VFNSTELTTTHSTWWRQLRLRLTLLYVVAACILLFLSAIGHARLLGQVGQTFGGFFWGIDTDRQVDIVSVPPQLPPLDASPGSLTGTDHLVKVNGKDITALSNVYRNAQAGQLITYTVEQNGKMIEFPRPAATFTLQMWLQNYGLALFAGISWLLIGGILLATAREWTGAVEGITLLPPAMLFLLYSHWGNVQQAYQPDAVFQLLWVPAFALLGAAFIHLSLTYRPEALSTHRRPSLKIDGLPYLPLIALVAYDLGCYFIRGSVPTRLQFTMTLSYAVLGGILSLIIGIRSLLRISRRLPGTSIPANVRRRLGDLLTLWIGGVGLGFCLGILPILLTGKPLLPLEIFYVLATVYPLIMWYAIHSLRLIERLETTLAQREEALHEQQKTEAELRQANAELQRATSLLLHADAHLRSLLSQRIHDQPKQQALRIRSLLGHWQHKLKVEAERDPYTKNLVQPVIEALGKVRKISEELEGDLRGLQLLVEDAYQRRSLGLKLHLEKLIREDLPALHPESLLKVQPDLWALDELSQDLEQTAQGEKIAEAISYTVTQALLNVYNHAAASYATVRTVWADGYLSVYVIDDGRGFDKSAVSPEKTSLFKAELKAREAGGTLTIRSIPRSQAQHGTTVILRLPFPGAQRPRHSRPLPQSMVEEY
jgi:signal transduction histidine kinase